MIFQSVLLCYFVLINMTGFVIMGIDKKRAVRGAWRISERSLFLVAWLGGSLGCILGMRHFRHKTRHRSFLLGMPAIFLLEITGSILLYLAVNFLR